MSQWVRFVDHVGVERVKQHSVVVEDIGIHIRSGGAGAVGRKCHFIEGRHGTFCEVCSAEFI